MKKNSKSIANESSKLIREKTKEKLFLIKTDPSLIALLFVEFVLTLIIVGAILLYLDGRFNTIQPPFNLFIFGAIVFAVLHFYKYTEVFRKVRGMKRESSFKSFLLEFSIFIILVFSAYIYQDPTINIVPYPFNLVLFLGLLAVPVYLYVDENFLKK